MGNVVSRLQALLLKGDSRSSLVKKNILMLMLIKCISVVVSLALVPLTLSYVSSELYGIWLTLSSIVVWMFFFDIGFNLGLKNRLAEALAVKDYARGQALVSTTYLMLVAIFVPLGILFELVIPYVPMSSLLNVPQAYNEEIVCAMRILIVCFCMQMIVGVISAVSNAHQKVALASAFPVIGNVLSFIIIFLMTKFVSPSLSKLAIAISAMPVLVMFVAGLILFRTQFKRVAPSWRAIHLRYVRDLLQLGIKFFVIKVQLVVMYQMTNVLISHLSGPNVVTSYNIAYKFLNGAMMVYTIILDPLWPAFTDAYTKKDYGWMHNVYRKMERVFLVLCLVILLMVVLSPYVYRLWIGQRAEIPLQMTVSVAVYMLILAWHQLQIMPINGTGCVKLQSYVTLIGLFFHIPFSLFLGRWYGGLGVIYSMSAILVVYCVFFTIQIRRLINQTAVGIWCK